MTDAALIALATSSAAVTVVAIGAGFMQSWWLRDAKDAAARYQAQASTLTEQIKASAVIVSTLTADLKTANARVEAIDAENQKLRAAMPVDGAYQRMLSSVAAEAASGGAGGGVVPDGQRADKGGPNDLLDPAKA